MLNKIISFVDFALVRAAGEQIDISGSKGVKEAAGTPFATLDSFVDFVINLVFGIGIAVALVFLIVCGIKYATSSGDQGKAEEARNCITNAIIGAVVVIAFRVLFQLALTILGIGTGAETTTEETALLLVNMVA